MEHSHAPHSHGHTHGHSHGHGFHSRNRNMLFSVGLNLAITVAEFVGGFLSNSLALLSDALHNLSDTLAIALSYIALRFGNRPSDEHNTFGFRRYEILAALFNAVVLIGISIYLFAEAWQRFMHPQPIRAGLMLAVALIGFVANLASILLLHADSKENLNVRSAYLHLLGDTLSSVGVIVGGITIHYLGWTWVDPLVTVLVGIVIIRHAWEVVAETVGILAMSTPPNVDCSALKIALETHPQVSNVHHLHTWRLHDSAVHFECHADLAADLPTSQADQVRTELVAMLQQRGITHATIQMEYHCCTAREMIVAP